MKNGSNVISLHGKKWPECICQAASRRWASPAFPYPLFWQRPATPSKLAFCNLNATQRCSKFYCSRAPKKGGGTKKQTNKRNSLIKGKKGRSYPVIEWNEPISLKKRTTQITKPGRASKQLVQTPSAVLDGQPPTPSSLSPTHPPRPDSSTASRHYADEAQAPHSTHVTATPPQHPPTV